MKILRLDLTAFGRFAQHSLDLSGGEHGIHLIYGANEAGKSTALRALRSLFYGIDRSSSDDFLHPKARLRIGALVRHSDGRTLEFVRRRGQQNSYLQPNGEPGDESDLLSWLGTVNEPLFTNLFGVDHPRLRAGGEEILRGGGDVGQSLFAAGLGGKNLREVLARLDAEAAELFLPRGSKQVINRLCREHHEAKTRVREAMLSVRDFEERTAALKRAQAESERLGAELEHLRREGSRWQRLRRAWPLLGQREAARATLQAEGEPVVLAANFSERRAHWQTARESAHARLELSAKREADLAETPDAATGGALLERAALLEDLHTRLGGHLAAALDLPKLEAEQLADQRAATRLAGELREGLTPGQAETLRVAAPARRKVQALIEARTKLDERQQASERVAARAVQASQAAEARRSALLETPEAPALRHALAAAQKEGDLEREAARHEAEAASLEASLAREAARLKPPVASMAALTALAVPSTETVARYAQEWKSLEARSEKSVHHFEDAESTLTVAEKELAALLLGGEVPDEGALSQARAQRDALWSALRAKGAAPTAPEGAVYEERVRAADLLADRLRLDADRVARKFQLGETVAEAAAGLTRARAGQEAAGREWDSLRARWRAEWAPLEPLPPAEMLGWLAKQARLLEKADQARLTAERAAAVRERIAFHLASLHAALPPAPRDSPAEKTLAQCIEEGLAQASLREKSAAARRKAEDDFQETARQCAEAEADRHAAHQAQQTWAAHWAETMRGLGWLEGETPAAAQEILTRGQELLALVEKMADRQGRIRAISDSTRGFGDAVAPLCRELAPDRLGAPPEETVRLLHRRLAEARREQTQREALARQRQAAEADRQEAEAACAEAERQLHALAREAGCTDRSELAAVERRALDQAKLRDRLEALDDRLLAESGGAPLPDFLAELTALHGDDLDARLIANGHEVTLVEKKRDEFQQEVGERRLWAFGTKPPHPDVLNALEGKDPPADDGPAASEAQDEVFAIRAALERHTERYVRLRLAAGLLRREIERYRAENQAPILRHASAYFRELTADSFIEIATDFDASDQPLLQGVRAHGERVGVRGMSEGTRDQLFLALQLASVEKFIAASEPLPFIVDDVLVAFDEEREAAVLRALARLAKKTQVIVFTHHRHLVETARAALPADVLFEHRLPGRAS